jgi:hypothetical protein
MDKKKKGKEKVIDTSDKGLDKKKGGKSYVILSMICGLYLDSNYQGDVYYYNGEERNLYHKWLFEKTDSLGQYYLKNVVTGLYLTSDELGNLLTTTFLGTAYQKWKAFINKELDSAIKNVGNDYFLSINPLNKIILVSYDCTKVGEFVFAIDPKKPEKK